MKKIQISIAINLLIIFGSPAAAENREGLSNDIMRVASEEIGVTELAGDENNQRIQQYFESQSYFGMPDSVSWCSAFVGFVAIQTLADTSGADLSARSWLRVGIEVIEPRPGDVVVLWRNDPIGWQGHVGFYVGETYDKVLILGGNQGNQVNVTAFAKNRVLGYRRLELPNDD